MKQNFLVLFLALVVFCGCAVGPLMSQETARTVGDSKNEISGGIGQAGYLFKWSYGLTEDFDLGVQWESLSVGVRAKYAFLNSRETGWALATALGAGSSFGGNHYYADLMTSYLHGSWEPYGTVRFVHIKTDPLEFKDKDSGQLNFTVPKTQYDYGQVFLGLRYWMNPQWMISLEAASLFGITSGLEFKNNAIAAIALGHRF